MRARVDTAKIARRWRVDPVLVIVIALSFSAAASVAPLATLVAASLSLALLWPRLSAAAVGAVLVAFAVGWLRAGTGLASFDRDHASARDFLEAPSRCAAAGRVASSPAERGGVLRFDVELESLDCDGRRRDGPVRVRLYTEPAALARGDELALVADLGAVGMFQNLDLPDPKPSAARRGAVLSGKVLSLDVQSRAWGLTAAIDRARAHVRARIDATFSESVRGMARALVLGESDLSEADTEAFNRSGLSHLLAVSGTHLIFAVLSLVRALRAVLLRCEPLSARCDVGRLAALLGLALAPLYADFAGGSGSAWRAAWMLVAVLGVRALGRRVFPSRIIAASLGAGWALDGLVIFDPSFLLSLAATIGLVCMGAEQDDRSLRRAVELTEPRAPNLVRLGHSLSRAALTTLAATLPCVPILLSIAPGITLASVAANLLAAPLGEIVALPLCLAHGLLAPLPALEQGVALVASGALAVIRGLAHTSASVDFLYFELPPPARGHLAVLAVSAAALVSIGGRPWLGRSPIEPRLGSLARWLVLAAAAVGLLAAEASARAEHAPSAQRGRLRITALDVAQGDATLVDLPDGRLMLIDAGGFVGSTLDPGELVVVPTLRARRRSRIDIVVLTHPHPDHFGGLHAVAEKVEIGELWYGGEPPGAASEHAPHGSGSLAALLHRLRRSGVKLRPARELCAAREEQSGYRLRVLAPCPDVAPEQSANDNSLVLRIELGQRAALLTGDAERWAEAQLIGRHPDGLAADFLKVGHHGSRTSSSPELIARVRPSVATISCGVRNRFGHPHAETLHTLEQFGVQALRLDRTGAVEWQTDGGAAYVRSLRATH